MPWFSIIGSHFWLCSLPGTMVWYWIAHANEWLMLQFFFWLLWWTTIYFGWQAGPQPWDIGISPHNVSWGQEHIPKVSLFTHAHSSKGQFFQISDPAEANMRLVQSRGDSPRDVTIRCSVFQIWVVAILRGWFGMESLTLRPRQAHLCQCVRIRTGLLGADRAAGHWRWLEAVEGELNVFRWVPTGERTRGTWGLYTRRRVNKGQTKGTCRND